MAEVELSPEELAPERAVKSDQLTHELELIKDARTLFKYILVFMSEQDHETPQSQIDEVQTQISRWLRRARRR